MYASPIGILEAINMATVDTTKPISYHATTGSLVRIVSSPSSSPRHSHPHAGYRANIWTILFNLVGLATLQKLMGYFNQSMVSSVAASLSCLQVQSTYRVCICHQRHIGFVLWTIVL